MRMTFGSMRGSISKEEFARLLEPARPETPEQRLQNEQAANAAYAEDRAKHERNSEIPKAKVALYVLEQENRRWPPELQPLKGTPLSWLPQVELMRHQKSALVVVPLNSMTTVLYNWYTFQAVKRIKETPNLTVASCGMQLPSVQITSSTQLVQMTFGNEKGLKPPAEWVSRKSELVAIWLDSGARKHEAAMNGVIDIINTCEARGTPLWIGCSHKWRYGKSHPLHHERIDEWLAGVPTFEIGKEGGLCA